MKNVNYESRFGEYKMPSELYEQLKGLSIEEQLNYFRMSKSSIYTNTFWSSRTQTGNAHSVLDDENFRGVIVDKDIVVGVLIKDWCNYESSCLIDNCVCTYSSSDNNGAGYKERDDYTYFFAVPDSFEK